MHPKVLLDACAELVRLTLTFEHPADAVVSPFATTAAWARAARHPGRNSVHRAAQKALVRPPRAIGFWPQGRRLAILGFHG